MANQFSASAYSIENHAVLSQDAQDLHSQSADDFTEMVEACHVLLEMPLDLDGTDRSTARLALARQVNFLVEKGAMSAVLSSKNQASKSWSFKDDVPVDPVADALADQVRTDDGQMFDYESQTSFR